MLFARTATLTALMFTAAMFGFFYAWICSTMWGLATLDPNTAIAAMQGMNASVRNGVFGLAFFGTPLVTAIAAFACYTTKARASAILMLLAMITYTLGALILTMSVNVPMNEALALITLPQPAEAAAQIWSDYTTGWEVWNITRTGFAGLATLLTGLALLALPKR